MKNLGFIFLLLFEFVLFQTDVFANDAISILCESKPAPIALENGGAKTIPVGWTYKGVGVAQETCMKQQAPNDISCNGSNCGPGYSAIISRKCRMKVLPGQKDNQADTDDNDPSVDDQDPSSIVNYIVPETSFPCESGQETCEKQEKIGKNCTTLNENFKKMGNTWQSGISTSTPGFKDWDKIYCRSPRRGLTKLSLKEAKCIGDQIVEFPALEFQAYCISPDTQSHRVSIQLSWIKSCVESHQPQTLFDQRRSAEESGGAQ